MNDLPDHAYAHACAVLGPGEAAAEVAATALRRGGRALWAVLGHTRHQVLEMGTDAERTDLDAPAPEDLTDLAVELAASRPAIERVVVDLDGRHSLDRIGFARALGLPPAAAAVRAAAVFSEWQLALDPVILARLGCGGCEGLEGVLAPQAALDVDGTPDGADNEPRTLRALLDSAPAVTDHAAGCPPCADRLRAMVSVRTLLAQRPLEPAPENVLVAAIAARLRRPAAAPPLEPQSKVSRGLRPVALIVAAVMLAIVGGITSDSVRRNRSATTVEALTKVPVAGNALHVTPSSLEGPTPRPVVLSNRSDRELRWEAVADAPWLRVLPSAGELAPGAASELRLVIAPGAPEGDLRAAVRITGVDGSVTVVRLDSTIERSPDVAAVVDGCVVFASVEDEGEIRAVELHLSEAAGRTALGASDVSAMDPTDGGYTRRVHSGNVPMAWWVTAVDARGNVAATPESPLPVGACP